MKTDYDVIIIGAGPAGASCANYLNKKNVNTLIIEKQKLPVKKCCAGMYSPRAKSFIETNFDKLPKNFECTNNYLELKLSKRSERYYKTTSPVFSNLNRVDVDSWLLKKSGAKVYDNSSVITYKNINNKIKVIYKRNNKEFEVTCNFLIGADGANSLIRKNIDESFKKRTFSFTTQFVYSGKVDFDKNVFHVCINKKYTDEFFAWYYMKNDLVYIGTSWLVGSKYNLSYYHDWLNFLKKNHDFSITEEYRTSCFAEYFNNFNKPFFGKENILIVGEATGLISTFGEGIPTALVTGKMAAESIVESGDTLRAYEDKVKLETNYIKEQFKNFNLIT